MPGYRHMLERPREQRADENHNSSLPQAPWTQFTPSHTHTRSRSESRHSTLTRWESCTSSLGAQLLCLSTARQARTAKVARSVPTRDPPDSPEIAPRWLSSRRGRARSRRARRRRGGAPAQGWG